MEILEKMVLVSVQQPQADLPSCDRHARSANNAELGAAEPLLDS
jgi:hypothetical protein